MSNLYNVDDDFFNAWCDAFDKHVNTHLSPKYEMVCHNPKMIPHIDVRCILTKLLNQYVWVFLTQGMSMAVMASPLCNARECQNCDSKREGSCRTNPKRMEIFMIVEHDPHIEPEAFIRQPFITEIISILATTGKVPHIADMQLGLWHSIGRHRNHAAYSKTWKFGAEWFVDPLLTPEAFDHFRFSADTIDDDEIVHLFAVIPLYRNEIQFRLQTSSEALWNKFMEHGISEIININRPSCIQKNVKTPKKRVFWCEEEAKHRLLREILLAENTSQSIKKLARINFNVTNIAVKTGKDLNEIAQMTKTLLTIYGMHAEKHHLPLWKSCGIWKDIENCIEETNPNITDRQMEGIIDHWHVTRDIIEDMFSIFNLVTNGK